MRRPDRQTERLAGPVRGASDGALEHTTHYATEPPAKKLEKTGPDLSPACSAQGMRIVNQKKSKYYDAALENFERAKRCYERAGLAAEWEKTVRLVRDNHSRKAGLISGFEAPAAGARQRRQPSFLESAKARWGGKHGRGDS